MRIFDPKDQLGNSLLSQADTTKSSVKLEKQMAVGGTITLTSTDISDIENWELSNARVKVDGQMISFLPDTSRDTDGNLVITLGETFSDVVLVLKRTVFDGMKQEEEDIIEVEIRQLMAKTLAAAGKPEYDADENIKEWQDLGEVAEATGEEKYRYANVKVWSDDIQLGSVVTEPFLSLRSLQFVSIQSEVTEWRSDLPALENAHCLYISGPLEVFDAKMPNLKEASCMFQNKTSLRFFNSEIPSLAYASNMFEGCSGLNSWTVALPNSLINALGMFQDCTGLRSFSTPSDTLPNSLGDVSYMFYGCTGLRNFTPSLAGLTNCEDFENMFSGCKLNKASVQNIVNTIPTYTSGSDAITIGYDSTEITQEDEDAFNTTLTNKGWMVAWQRN